jgi:hypothetical protein
MGLAVHYVACTSNSPKTMEYMYMDTLLFVGIVGKNLTKLINVYIKGQK